MSDGERIIKAALEALLDEVKGILFAAETEQLSVIKRRAPELRGRINAYESTLKLYFAQKSGE